MVSCNHKNSLKKLMSVSVILLMIVNMIFVTDITVFAEVINSSNRIITETDGDWSAKYFKSDWRNPTSQAEYVVRVGDIDDFGLGWVWTKNNFWGSNFGEINPFSGTSTTGHYWGSGHDSNDNFQWDIINANEPNGLDRIITVSSYKVKENISGIGADGYSNRTIRVNGRREEAERTRPTEEEGVVDLEHDISNIIRTSEEEGRNFEVKAAMLQMFVDDFQAKAGGARAGGATYQVNFIEDNGNETRVTELEDLINHLNQTGPIGKLITFEIPFKYLDLLRNNNHLKIRIDDPITGAGDGYAIDFVKLLINPRELIHEGSIQGYVRNDIGDPIDKAYVEVNGKWKTYTNNRGYYKIDNVTSGLASVKAYKAGEYKEQTKTIDVIDNRISNLSFQLEPIYNINDLVEIDKKVGDNLGEAGKEEYKVTLEIQKNNTQGDKGTLNLKDCVIQDEIADEFEIVPASHEAIEVKKNNSKSFINKLEIEQIGNKLKYSFNDTGNKEKISISYRIKRADKDIEEGIYPTSRKPATLTYEAINIKPKEEKTIQFPQVEVQLSQGITEELISIDRNVKGDSSNINEGKEFEVEYTITPQPIPVSKVQNTKNKEIVLVIDTSGSMDWDVEGNETYYNSKKRLTIMKKVAGEFVDKFKKDINDNKVKIGLVKYSSKGSVVHQINNNFNQIKNTINSNELTADGGTNIGDGLRKAYHMLDNSNGSDKYIVLMTDGVPTAFTAKKNTVYYSYYHGTRNGYVKNSYGEDYFSYINSFDYRTDNSENNTYVINYGASDYNNYSLNYAATIGSKIAENDKIKTFVVGFGNGVDASKNVQIANSVGGIYKNALNESQINAIYDEFAKVIDANISGEISFEEVLPNAEFIEVIKDMNGVHPKGSNAEWLTVEANKISGNLRNVYYTLNEEKTYYVAEPIKFSVTFKGKKSCTLGKNDSSFVEYTVSKKNGNKSEKKYFDELEIDIKQTKRAITSVTRRFPNNTIQASSEYEMVYNIDGDELEYYVEKPVDIVLVLNTSRTMKTYVQNKKLQKAAKEFVDNLPVSDNVKVGVVRYYYKGKVVSELQATSNKSAIKREIDSKISSSLFGTNLGDGLRRAYQLLEGGNPHADKHLVILSDGYANVGIKERANGRRWENVPYVFELDDSVNSTIDNNGHKFFPLNDNNSGFMNEYNDDRFNIGHEYVTGIAEEINKSDLKINSHIIHFKRVSGAGDNEGAMKNNNEVARVLGIEKEVDNGQKFYLAENGKQLIEAFNTVGAAIKDSIPLNKFYYEETFPAGVELVKYPSGLTKTGTVKTGYTLKGNISDVNMKKVSDESNLYKVDGKFSITIKCDYPGKYDFHNGKVIYEDPDGIGEELLVNDGSIEVAGKKLDELKILEVQPTIDFELEKSMFTGIAKEEGIELVQMSMPQFISDINKINGNFDIVYLGSKNGEYTHIGSRPDKLPQNLKTNGTDSLEYYSENDITNRKAHDLKEFIESGQLTIFANSVFMDNETKLYLNFNSYKNSKDNFITTNEVDDTVKTIGRLYDECNKRPILTISSSPKDFIGTMDNDESGTSNAYEDTKVMNFIFDLQNQNTTDGNENSMNVKLYLDKNGDGFFREEEMVEQGEPRLNGRSYSLDYRLEDYFTGMMPWKLEIEDTKTGTKAFKIGYPAYKGEKLQVRVLQLIPPGNTFDVSKDMKVPLRTEYYNVKVTTLRTSQFNENYPNPIGDIETELNGNYDMIILGFADGFNNGDLTIEAVNAIKEFIKTGQSVMFTHDNMSYHVNNYGEQCENLTEQFRDIIGQSRYNNNTIKNNDSRDYNDDEFYSDDIEHDPLPDPNKASYGFSKGILDVKNNKAPNHPHINKTYKLNDGLFTKYPYNLADNDEKELNVATTHEQYFQLNLEDEDVIPWFTLNGYSNNTKNNKKYFYDKYDGRNNYYTYTKGNITYSGTGHSKPDGTGSKKDEHEMFMNTIIKASRSANHAPTLEVINLEKDKIVSKSQDKFEFSFIASDIDGDLLSGEVYINSVLVESYDKGDIKHGEPINALITKGDLQRIVGEDEEFTIKIVVKDNKGAVAEENGKLKYFDNPALNMSIDKVNKYLVGDTAHIKLQAAAHTTSDNLTTEINNIKFSMDYDSNALGIKGNSNWNLDNVIFNPNPNPAVQQKTFEFGLHKAGNYIVRNTLTYDYSNFNSGVKKQTANYSYPISVRSGAIDVRVVNSDGTAFGRVQVSVNRPDGSTIIYNTDENGAITLGRESSGEYTFTLNDIDENYMVKGGNSKTIHLSYSNHQQVAKFELIDTSKIGLDLISEGGNEYLVGDTADINLTAIAHNDDENIHTTIKDINYSMAFDSDGLELTTEGNSWNLNNVPISGSDIESNREQRKKFTFKIKEEGEYKVINTLEYEYLNHIKGVSSAAQNFFVKSGKIKVKVVKLDGRPYENVPITITDKSSGKILYEGNTDELGTYNLADVPTGNYIISTSLPDGFDDENGNSREVELSYSEAVQNVEFKLKNDVKIINNGMYINNSFVSTNKVVTGFEADLAAEFEVYDKEPDIRLILDEEITKAQLKLYKVDDFGNLTVVDGNIDIYKVEEVTEDGSVVEELTNLNPINGKVDLRTIQGERKLKIVIPKSSTEYNHYILQYTISQKAPVTTTLEHNIEVNNVTGEEKYLEVVDLPKLD